MPEASTPGAPGREDSQDPDWLPPELNTGVAHTARVYNYWLGGKDNYAADRALGDAVIAAMPQARFAARANRDFLGRAVRYLAVDAGIRQYLDIGTGIPAAGNTHEVAQAAAPDSRIFYVDNDPIVLAHARGLTTSAPGGAIAFIQADLHEPDRILAIRCSARRWTWASRSRSCCSRSCTSSPMRKTRRASCRPWLTHCHRAVI